VLAGEAAESRGPRAARVPPACYEERMSPLAPADHRAYPPPQRPWVMRQVWRDLLFAHWPVDPGVLRPRLPAGLEPELFDGAAWVTVAPFRMTGIRLRGLPPVPGTTAFPELNVRTYAVVDDRPGVFFFSLDAAHRLAVAVARRWFRLPYFHARMTVSREGRSVRYASQRAGTGAEGAFEARYEPAGAAEPARAGTLDHWLTERYCLYTEGRRGTLKRGEIHHRAWPLQPARVELATCGIAEAYGVAPDAEPALAHFAERLDVVCWSPERVVTLR